MSEPDTWRRHIQNARYSLLDAEVSAERLDKRSFSLHLMAASESLAKAHFSFEPAEDEAHDPDS